jgi:hypothetical protein
MFIWSIAVCIVFSLVFLLLLDNSTVLHKPPLVQVRGLGTKEDDHAPPDGCGHLSIGVPYILIRQKHFIVR